MEGNKPEKKFKAGAVSATVWKNNGQFNGKETSYFSVSVDRRYKDKDGNWKSTTSWRASDIPRLTLVLNKAYEFIVLQEPENAISEETVY